MIRYKKMMRLLQVFIIICLTSVNLSNGYGQTTYTASPNPTPCVAPAVLNVGGTNYVRGAIKIEFTPPTQSGSPATFGVRMCDGSAFPSGTNLKLIESTSSNLSSILQNGVVVEEINIVIGNQTIRNLTYNLSFSSGQIRYYVVVMTTAAKGCTEVMAITASSPSPSVDIRLNQSMSFGSTTLVQGQTYTFSTQVRNYGTSSWTGGLYLKLGNTDIDGWSRTITAGGTTNLSCTYTPTSTGTFTFTLWYATNDIPPGSVVPPNGYNNPMTLTVTAPPCQTPSKPSSPTPSHTATGVSTTPIFSWNSTHPQGGTVYYRLLLGTVENTLATEASGTGNSTSGKTINLQAGTKYYWKIESSSTSNFSGCTSFGDTWSFTTTGTSPANPVLSLSSTSVVYGNSLTITGSGFTTNNQAQLLFSHSGGAQQFHTTYVNTNSSGAFTYSFNSTLAGTAPITVTVTATDVGSGKQATRTFDVTPTSSGSCNFPSLPTTNAFYDATCYLFNKNILTNIITSSVTPSQLDGNITRRNMANIAFQGVYRLFTQTGPPATVPSDNYPLIYEDLTSSDRAIRSLLYLEYDDGRSPFDRTRILFKPTDNIERVFVVKVLLETFNIPPDLSNPPNPFPSDSQMTTLRSNNQLHYGYMCEAQKLGIIGQGRPSDYCTLGEAFVMLFNIMDKIEKNTLPNSYFKSSNPAPANVDYFEPLNVTLLNLALGLSMEMGNFNHYTKTSFSLDGVVPLDFTHTYNSYNAELPDMFFGKTTKQEETGEQKTYMYQPLGPGWSHTYHSFITQADNKCIVHWGGGTIHVYKVSGSQWVPESLGVYDELSFEGTTILIKTKSQIEYRFKRTISDARSDGTVKLYEIKDRNGNTLTISYGKGIDNVERITSVSDGNRSLTFTYRNNTNLLQTISDPLGREITFGYISSDFANGGYMLSGFKDAKNYNSYYSYVNNGHPKKSKLLSEVKLPKGNSIKNDYDNNRRLAKTVAVLNNVEKSKTEITTTPLYSTPVKTVNSTVKISDGTSTRNFNYTHNSNNNVTGITGNQNLNITASYTNNTNPVLPTAISSNSDKAEIVYDNRGNPTKITQLPISGSGNRVTNIAYNSRNDVTTITDSKGITTFYDYDTKGNLTKIRAPESSVTNITVNSKGLPVTITNPENIVTEYTYNNYGNVKTTKIPVLNLTSTFNYDDASRVTSAIDFLNRTTTFTYDENDNLVSEMNAANHKTSYEYDLNDNLTKITNAKNNSTTMNYDNTTDWLTSVSFGGFTKSYEYNNDGTLKKFTKPDNTALNSTYDNLGRITNDGVNTYTYDGNHRLATIAKGGRTLTFEYDGFSQMTGVTYSDFANNKVSYTYDANGNILTMVYPGNKTVTYTYDNLNRMKTVKDWNNNTITYNYLKDNRLQSISYPNGMTVNYSYDNAGRQTGKTVKRSNNSEIASYSFTLDNVGNILTETRTEPYDAVPLTNETISYTYNSANRITNAGGTSFTFDANGNTKTRGSNSYNYDNLDKLTSGGGFNFEYDGLGNIRSNGTKRYMIDVSGMGNVIAETNMSGTVSAYYIYGAGGLEARILPNNTTHYYVSDYRGSVVAMVDATTSANITHKYQYDDFGNITQQQENDENVFRYVGKYGVMYANDNLYYMRARFYDPTIGRFLTEDPIWSTNLYPYADNNPVMGIDPEGLYTSPYTSDLKKAAESLVTVEKILNNLDIKNYYSATNFKNDVAKWLKLKEDLLAKKRMLEEQEKKHILSMILAHQELTANIQLKKAKNIVIQELSEQEQYMAKYNKFILRIVNLSNNTTTTSLIPNPYK